ncbi:MAG: hypothetical protein C4581_00090 [Nitrospiraceae bacterium]|nr:MAG: hypothetical protein C4581_00090 [Nitrospiraceae bacterium]
MSQILEIIKTAEKGSNIYHLIEKVAAKVNRENPCSTDEDNWFEAQARINRFIIEEKVAEKCYEKDPHRSYEDCLEEARNKLEDINLNETNDIAISKSELETIVQCNLKYYSNYYFTARKQNKEQSEQIEKAFQDWLNAIDCVAYNISLYQ